MILSTVVWDVDPIAFNLFGIPISWYGCLWSTTIALSAYIFYRMIQREKLDPRLVESGFFYVVFGTIIGARLGHCLFYDPAEYLLDPFMAEFPWIKILDIRGGGLASHGAALGILVSGWLFTRKWKIPYIWILDRLAVMVPIGGALVRLGNLLNSEIYGTSTNLPWGFIFVNDGQTVPMHPTQLYEALAYLLIFALTAHLYWRTRVSDERRGVMFGLFLSLLFIARFVIETIKEPQEEFERGMALNMGQLLSIPFIVGGIIVLWMALRRPPKPYTDMPRAKPEPKKKKR